MKILKILAVSCAITIMSSFSAFADWEQVGTQWKYKDEVTDGYVASQWIESTTEKGLWYYLDENGLMATNTVIDNQYYVNEAGEWRESSGGSSSVNPGNQSNNTQEKVPGTDIGWNADGSFNWGDLGASENLTSGGPISESEKESGQNFINNR